MRLVIGRGTFMYLCNCNGIRERDGQAAIAAGAARPAEIFRHCGARPQCAKCVCDMRRMIDRAQGPCAHTGEAVAA